ncbi:MAG: hypothetical protein ABI112_00820 [Terracoccus sp.]
MNPGRRSGITLTSVFALLALCACGTATSPGPGGASSGKTGSARATTRAASTQSTLPDGGLACPATIPDGAGMTVPQPPAGADGTARLLPDRPPSSMVVCAYPVLDRGAAGASHPPLLPPFPIESRTVATSTQRAQITDLLAWAPRGGGPLRSCTAIGGSETVYLVGALYGAPELPAATWVAAKAEANACSPATNGDFVARKGVGSAVESIVTGPRTDPLPGSGSLCSASLGRLGDDGSLAPEGAPLVTVCRPGRDSQIPTALDVGQSAAVVAALRALPTRPSADGCSMADGAQDAQQRDFRLVLRYDEGPPAVVYVHPGCRPELFGPGLEAEDASSVVKLVDQWSKPVPYLDPDASVSSNGSGSSAGRGQGGATGNEGTPDSVAPTGPAPLTGFPPAGPAMGSPLQPSGPLPAPTPAHSQTP